MFAVEIERYGAEEIETQEFSTAREAVDFITDEQVAPVPDDAEACLAESGRVEYCDEETGGTVTVWRREAVTA